MKTNRRELSGRSSVSLGGCPSFRNALPHFLDMAAIFRGAGETPEHFGLPSL
jgi:hypothetical protein